MVIGHDVSAGADQKAGSCLGAGLFLPGGGLAIFSSGGSSRVDGAVAGADVVGDLFYVDGYVDVHVGDIDGAWG